MKRWLAVVGVVILTAALVFLNQGMKKGAVLDHDEDEAPAQSQKAATIIDPRAVLPAEETVGDPKTATHHIELGWVYANNYYRYPESLNVPMEAIHDYVQNSNGTVSAEIVDLDVPLEDRSPLARSVTDLGMKADGQILYSSNPSDSASSVNQITQGLDGVIKKR